MAFDYSEIFLKTDVALREEPGLRLSELAKRLSCSYRIIEDAVMSHTGMSFRNFRMAKRTQKEMYLISMGFLKKEVAHRLGYRHPGN